MAFKKKISNDSSRIAVSGAKFVQNSWKISSGMSSFDKYTGDGLDLGSLTVVVEDSSAYLARLFTNSFLCEGQRCGHESFFGSVNHPMLDVRVPPLKVPSSDRTVLNSESDDSLTIAWRYQSLPKYTDGSQPSFLVEETPVQLSKVKEWDGSKCVGSSSYSQLLKDINSIASEFRVMPGDVGEKKPLRVSLVSLGTTLWGDEDPLAFLVYLKAILRRSYAAAVVTLPAFCLQKTPSFTSRLRNLADVFITLVTIDPGVHEELQSFDAVVSIEFPNTVNSFYVIYPDTKDLAVKLSRNQLVVEKVHLTPGIREDEKKPVSRVDF